MDRRAQYPGTVSFHSNKSNAILINPKLIA